MSELTTVTCAEQLIALLEPEVETLMRVSPTDFICFSAFRRWDESFGLVGLGRILVRKPHEETVTACVFVWGKWAGLARADLARLVPQMQNIQIDLSGETRNDCFVPGAIIHMKFLDIEQVWRGHLSR